MDREIVGRIVAYKKLAPGVYWQFNQFSNSINSPSLGTFIGETPVP